MNRKLYSILTVVAVSFALVIGFGGFTVVKAAPSYIGGESPNPPADAVNLVGADLAKNSPRAVTTDSDSRASGFAPDTYGLHGTLQP